MTPLITLDAFQGVVKDEVPRPMQNRQGHWHMYPDGHD